MIIKKNNYTNLFIGSIFLFFFLTGLIIYDDYGIGWDEYYQRINGFVALNFVREIFSLEEIYSHLKHSTINFAETAKIYGVIFDLPAAYFETLFEIKDSKDFFLFRHLANFIVFYISCIFLYLLLLKRFSKILSLIGLFFFLLSPRIFAESFYNNKDILFLSLFIIAVYFSLTFLDKSSYKNLFLSSLSSSILIATKVLGIIVPFIVIVFFALKLIDDKKNLRKNILKLFTFFFLLFTFTIIFWPYLWNSPLNNFLNTVKTFSSHPWTGAIFYFGEYISALNLPWHYPIIWILISTPILYLFLFFIGSCLIVKRIFFRFLNLYNNKQSKDLWVGDKERMDVIFFLIFYFTLFLVINLNSTLYNGWRHLYFIYPSLIYISIRGLEFLKRNYFKKYLLIIITPFLIFTLVWMVQNHPFQYVYFNNFAGKNPGKSFELDYWGLSNKNNLSYILNIEKNESINVYVLSNSPYYFSLLLLDKKKRKRIKFVNEINKADYLVTNHYYQKGYPFKINNDLKRRYKLVKEFKVDEMIINSIYKIN